MPCDWQHATSNKYISVSEAWKTRLIQLQAVAVPVPEMSRFQMPNEQNRLAACAASRTFGLHTASRVHVEGL